MVLMIWAVEIFTIPASREMDVTADTAWAWFRRQRFSVDPSILTRSADIASVVWTRITTVAVLSLQCSPSPRTFLGVADEHAETWLKSSDFAGLSRDIVYKYTVFHIVTEFVAKL